MNIFKIIRDLFSTTSEIKEPIITGGEYYIILPEMIIETINNPRDNVESFLFPTSTLRYNRVSIRMGKLIPGGLSENEFVPEGYGIELLPDLYEITNTEADEIISLPILLRHRKDNLYEAIGLSTTRTRRLRDWWDIRLEMLVLKKDIIFL